MEINGVYRFYQEGELIATHKNILTDEGVRLILRYMAGQASSLGGAIAVGIAETEATSSDVRLGFEVYRADVTLRNPDYNAGRVIFKGSIEQDVSFTATEAGLWSTATTEFDSTMITTFPEEEGWTNVTWGSDQGRVSPVLPFLLVDAGTTASTRAQVDMDLSGNSVDDSFSLAYFVSDSAETITLVFENTLTGGKLSATKDVSTVQGWDYAFTEFRKGDFTPTGEITWDSIDSFGVDVSSTEGTEVYLEALRLEDNDRTDASHVLVSRTVFNQPLEKTSTTPMDVEYALEFTVS